MRMNMAPAGTHVRPPTMNARPTPLPAQPRPMASRPEWLDDGPETSEDERIEAQRSNIKQRVFKPKSAETTSSRPFQPPYAAPQQPPTADTFSGLLSNFGYSPQAQKRSADEMANSYANPQKKPRQIAPAQAMPVPPHNPQMPRSMEITDITDPSERRKVERLLGVVNDAPIELALRALHEKKGHYDDAADHLVTLVEQRNAQIRYAASRQPIVLPSSDDELLMTPARPPKGIAMSNQQFYPAPQQIRRVPTKTIAQKYGSTQQQQPVPIQARKMDYFDTPPPQEIKKRTLMRGRKNRSPSPASRAAMGKNAIVLDDSADERDSGIQSEFDDARFDNRVLTFFNSCTALELCDMSSIPKDQAEHFVENRPYKSIQKVFDVQNPNNKTKSKKGSSFGERVWDKVYEMMKSYEAVDAVVKDCETMSKPLAKSMSVWGVDVYGKDKNDTGLDLVSLDSVKANSQDSSGKDSGIGTPISDDGKQPNGLKKSFIPQPPSLGPDVLMKDYQVVGLNWLYLLFKQGLSGILADDMGLGKTLQTIAFIAHLVEVGQKGPNLIVVPSATLENWLQEFYKFAPGLKVVAYYGSIPERQLMRDDYEDNRDNINVIVTTYQIAKAKDDIRWLRTYPFTCTIFDEGHMLKNPTSEVASKLTRIKSRFRLLLTGTPLQNNLNELMGLLKFLMPDIFAEREEDMAAIFKQSVSVTTSDATTDSRAMLLSKQRIDRARSMLTPFILRRKKWQVLKDLPKKTRHVVTCTLTSEQQTLYNTQLAKAWDIRERKSRGERIPAEENANVLIRLRQAAIHPTLFRCFYTEKKLRKIAYECPKVEQFQESNPKLIEMELMAYADFETHDLCSKHHLLHKYLLRPELWETSGKITELLSLLAKFKAEGHKTLVFSQFVMVLDILETVMKNRDIPYLRLDGSTKVDERQALIDVFNAPNSDLEVFMLSTKAGGAGINLTAASRVIVFDSGFNPQDDVQAENRCHRIGQTKDVEVYRLISEGTVEEQIYEMGKVKLQLDREVAGEEGQALDMPASGIATPAEFDDDVGPKKGKAKNAEKDTNGGLSKREAEGAALVEDLLFKKLEEQGKTAAELQSKSEDKIVPGVSKKLPNPRIKVKTANLKREDSSSSTLSSPLTELSSSEDEKDDESTKKGAQSSDVEVIDEHFVGRGRRKAAAKASKNLKDPFADDEPSSQTSNRSTRGKAKKDVKKEKGGQATISKSGRLVHGRKL